MGHQPTDHSPAQPVREQVPGDHLVFLPDANWALWSWFGLRGAGFPISDVSRLAMPACAAAADLFLVREAEAEAARKQALAVISEEASTARGEVWLQFLKLLRRVKEGKQPPVLPFALSAQVQGSLDSVQAAYRKREQARAELRLQFAGATERTMQELSELAQSGRFREAVMWQNRDAVRNGIEPFLRERTGFPPRDQQKNARLIASYLQRYCTKNDTIGFFGPIGWGRWTTQGADLVVRPGEQLLASRTVFFETWAIDALGEALARDPALLPWACPRPMPFLHLDGTTLHVPFARPVALSQAQAAVLAACDGRKTAIEVARTVLSSPACPGLASEAEVFALLEQLRQARRINWTFEVSMEDWHPEQALRRQLERITAADLRQAALARLDQLEDALAALVAAGGQVDQLDRAFAQLEATFTTLTGRAATREQGKTYAARTLAYEECRRDLELAFGPSLLRELGPPLALLLTSARWFTHAAAGLYRDAFSSVYRKLAQKAGSSVVDFAAFWSWVQPLVPHEPGQRLIDTLLPEFQKRWAAILSLPADQSRLHYCSQELQEKVHDAFAAPAPGWRMACYHSPDLLINATGPRAVLGGDYQFVLGEFHQGLNTLDAICLLSQHPALPELLRAVAADVPGPRVVPLFPRQTFPGKRLHSALLLPTDWRLVFGADSGGDSIGRALPIGQLVLEERDGKLEVRTRDGLHRFDLLEMFAGILSFQTCDAFRILAPAEHTPRITIDRLVICRETWRFAPADLPWAQQTDALECFVGIRRWARRHHLPRYLFVRTPNEKKPFYVDLESLISAEMFVRAVRQAQQLSPTGTLAVTEMLPDPEHAWLLDAEGKRYTSELRLVAVDQLKRPPTDS